MQFFGEDPADHELSGIDLIYLRKIQKSQTTLEKTTVTDKRTGNKIAEEKTIDIKSTTSGPTTHSVVKTESSCDSIKKSIDTKAVEVDLDRHGHVSEVVAQKVHVDLHNVKSGDEIEVKETIQTADTPIESKELLSKFEHPFHEHHHHPHHHSETHLLEHHSDAKHSHHHKMHHHEHESGAHKSHHHTKHMHEHESDTHKKHHHDGYDHHDVEEYDEYETDSSDEDFESAYIRAVVKHHGEECGCKYCSKSKYQHMKMKHAMAKKSHHHSHHHDQQHESDTHFHASQTGTQQSVFGTSGFNPMTMSGAHGKKGQTTTHESHERGHHEKTTPSTTEPPIDSLQAEYGKLSALITNYLKSIGDLSENRSAFYKLKLENAKRQLDFFWKRYNDTEQLPEQKEKARQGLISMRSSLPKLFFQIDGELFHGITE